MMKTTLELDSHRPLVSERLTEPPSELRKQIRAGFGGLDEDMQTIEKEDRMRMLPMSSQRTKVSETGRQPRQHQSAQPSAFSSQPQSHAQPYSSVNNS